MNQADILIPETLLTFQAVSKSYPATGSTHELAVLDAISLDVRKGEIAVLLGPSGCGKSTILNLAAGFEQAEAGLVAFDGMPVNGPSAQRGVVFQTAALFPWLTVSQNIAFGLNRQKCNKRRVQEITQHFIQRTGLAGFEHFLPHQLSGGMQQRAALARVLVLEPELLLMDEPFASLDAQSRLHLQQLLLAVTTELKLSVLFVTHDLDESLLLGDRIYLLSNRPSRIIREIQVPFDRPRPLSVWTDPSFTGLKQEILDLLFPSLADEMNPRQQA